MNNGSMINGVRKRSIGFSTSNMDASVDPFDDFYMHACGNWIKTHRLPKDKTSINSFYELGDINMLKLRRIAEYCAAKPNGSSAERVVGDFYASYMNVSELEKRKFTPIKPIIEKIDALQNKNELPATLARLYMLGIPVFLNVFSDCDKKKSDVYALYIQEAHRRNAPPLRHKRKRGGRHSRHSGGYRDKARQGEQKQRRGAR